MILSAIHHVNIDAMSVVIGLLLAIVVYVIVDWLLAAANFAPHQVIAAVLAVLTFLACVL